MNHEPAEEALRKVLSAVQRYLPPGGLDIKDAMSEIISAVDPWPLDKESRTYSDKALQHLVNALRSYLRGKDDGGSAYVMTLDALSARANLEKDQS